MTIRILEQCTLALVLATGLLGAQTKESKTAPVEVKRIAPPKPLPKEPVPTPDKYPFGQLIHTLGPDPMADAAQVGNGATAPPTSTGSASASDVPSDFRVSKDVPLPSTAQSALTVAKGWMAEKQTPAPGADGRVLYTYGAGMPTVVCAPMRVCVVELEAGEHLSGEPHVGDSVRWVISPTVVGSGRQETPMLVIKPRPKLSGDALNVGLGRHQVRGCRYGAATRRCAFRGRFHSFSARDSAISITRSIPCRMCARIAWSAASTLEPTNAFASSV